MLVKEIPGVGTITSTNDTENIVGNLFNMLISRMELPKTETYKKVHIFDVKFSQINNDDYFEEVEMRLKEKGSLVMISSDYSFTDFIWKLNINKLYKLKLYSCRFIYLAPPFNHIVFKSMVSTHLQL